MITKSAFAREISLSQEAWFHRDRVGAGQPPLLSILRLKGEWSRDAMALALRRVVQRQQVLASRFIESDAGVTLQYFDESEIAIDVRESVVDVPLEEHIADCARQIAAENLETWAGPLVRARMEVISTDVTLLFLLMHPLVTDRLSQRIVVRELAAYLLTDRTVTRDVHPNLDTSFRELSIQERAHWETRSSLVQDTYERIAASRCCILEGDLTAAGSPGQSHTETYQIDSATLSAAEACCSKLRLEPIVLAMASLAVLLTRRTDSNIAAFEVPHQNRKDPRSLGIVGPFTDAALITISVDDPARGRALLLAARAALRPVALGHGVGTNALLARHRDFLHLLPRVTMECSLSLDRMRQKREPGDSSRRFQLADSNGSLSVYAIDTPLHSARRHSRHDLHLSLLPDRDGARLRLDYPSSKFSREYIATFAAEYLRVFQQLAVD